MLFATRPNLGGNGVNAVAQLHGAHRVLLHSMTSTLLEEPGLPFQLPTRRPVKLGAGILLGVRLWTLTPTTKAAGTSLTIPRP